MLPSKKQMKFFTIIIFFLFAFTLNSWAIMYEFQDEWINWPGNQYNTTTLGDESGTPKLTKFNVFVDDNSFLEKIEIILHDSKKTQNFNSLFINNSYTNPDNWDQWNYFVHDGGQSNIGYTSGVVANQGSNNGDGLYSVDADYEYTTVIKKNRIDNPNGIDNNYLNILNDSFGPTKLDYTITYDFTNLSNQIHIDGGFFVAYAPWCANDLMGGGATTVPEPATMVIFGLSILGIVKFRKKA